MNERIRQLAEQAGAETWSRAPMRAVTGLAFTDENLEKFAELIRADHTQSVVKLCANTINNNLNEQARRKRNNYEVIELIVIVGAVIGWGWWWYTNIH
jgi:hypothetical protein